MILTNGMISCAGEKGTEDKTGNVSSPFKWRIIEVWTRPDNRVTFSKGGPLITTEEMLNTTPDSTLGRFVTQCREWGYNIMGFFGSPDQHPEAWANFARYLRENGMGLMLNKKMVGYRSASGL